MVRPGVAVAKISGRSADFLPVGVVDSAVVLYEDQPDPRSCLPDPRPLRLPGMSVSTANYRVHAWQGSDHQPGVHAGGPVKVPALRVRPDRVVTVADSTLPGSHLARH